MCIILCEASINQQRESSSKTGWSIIAKLTSKKKVREKQEEQEILSEMCNSTYFSPRLRCGAGCRWVSLRKNKGCVSYGGLHYNNNISVHFPLLLTQPYRATHFFSNSREKVRKRGRKCHEKCEVIFFLYNKATSYS